MPLLSLIRCYCQITEALPAWEQHLKDTGRSASTVSTYTGTLRQFAKAVGDVMEPTAEALQDWIRQRRHSVSLSTFNADLYALRAFYRWAFTWGVIASNYADNLPKSRRAPQRPVAYLDDYQVGWLIAAPDLGTLVGFRDHLMMRLLYETGLRAHEFYDLDMGAVDFERCMLFIDGGRQRPSRWVPFAESTRQLIYEWLKLRRSTRPGKSGSLWVTQHGKPFRSPRALWVIVNRYAREALGLGRGYDKLTRQHATTPWTGQYPHLLRASMAGQLLKNGCDLRAVQDILGHSTPETTARYLFMADLETMKAEIKKHPRAVKK